MKRVLSASVLAIVVLSSIPSMAQTDDASRQVERIERIAPGGQRAAARVLNSGVASHYARSLHGRHTANGERYNHNAVSAAHRSLPFGTLVRVSHNSNGRAIVVRINDRGPFVRGRQLDLSGEAARLLGFSGLARVQYEIVDPSTLPSNQSPPLRKQRHV